MYNKNLLSAISLLLSAVLYLIWPVAHTIALRKLILLIVALLGLVHWSRSRDRYTILVSPWLVSMGALLGWVIFHAAFISQNGAEAWHEFMGQWFPAYLAMLAGIGLALAGRNIELSKFKTYLFVFLAAQPILFLLVTLYKSVEQGQFAFGFMAVSLGTDLKTSLTFSSDMLAALSCAKLLETFGEQRKHFRRYIWLPPIALALFVAIFTQSTNSIILILACILLLFFILLLQKKIRVTRNGMILVILTATVLLYVLVNNSFVRRHWDQGIGNSKIALDIEHYNNWTNFLKLGLPKRSDGEYVPESFYLRVAWAKASVNTIIENPWGYGVTRQAFERLIQNKNPEASISNAHNGYLNLACAVGIPGLLLFVFALIAIFVQLKRSNSDLAHAAIWMIGIYVAHWALDALDRDHFFESYLFVIALLLTMTMNKSLQESYSK